MEQHNAATGEISCEFVFEACPIGLLKTDVWDGYAILSSDGLAVSVVDIKGVGFDGLNC